MQSAIKVLMLASVAVNLARATTMSARIAYGINTPDATSVFKSTIVPHAAPLLSRSMYGIDPLLTTAAMPWVSPFVSRPELSLSRSSMLMSPSLYPSQLAARTALSYPTSLQASPLIATAAPGLGMWSRSALDWS